MTVSSIRFLLVLGLASQPGAAEPFGIRVVDDQTGRGVPLVELETTNHLCFHTDSAGWVAFDEPGLMNTRVFFHIQSHGYEYPADGFGYRGTALDVKPGGRVTLKIKRRNLAERLYRITGQGVYVHSERLRIKPPIKQPQINGLVMGQDSTQVAILGERIFWTWGDTARPRYPLGHFGTAGATSHLPQAGGLDPAVGIDLEYLVDANGFSRPLFSKETPGAMIWIHGVFALEDDKQRPRMITHYAKMKSLGERLAHGLAVFDEESQHFVPLIKLPSNARLYPRGHAFRARDDDVEYLYFADPYPLIRVRADWASATDPTQYQAWTPLKTESDLDLQAPALDRDKDGQLHYAWRYDTALVDMPAQKKLQQQGSIGRDEGWIQTVDVETGDRIDLHRGSVRWNDYRQKWIMIANEVGGKSSYLGEVYYLEADRPLGPWRRAKKILTHDKYSFYNPVHHDFFDQQDGRIIYFEGTYATTFSAAKVPTPRYEYNTIMYCLDLSDPRLRTAKTDDGQ